MAIRPFPLLTHAHEYRRRHGFKEYEPDSVNHVAPTQTKSTFHPQEWSRSRFSTSSKRYLKLTQRHSAMKLTGAVWLPPSSPLRKFTPSVRLANPDALPPTAAIPLKNSKFVKTSLKNPSWPSLTKLHFPSCSLPKSHQMVANIFPTTGVKL